jgi:hypothetical protein
MAINELPGITNAGRFPTLGNAEELKILCACIRALPKNIASAL